ncbi:MAG: hypothetical protein AAFP22_13340, partial [Planctomycetota bacterium]
MKKLRLTTFVVALTAATPLSAAPSIAAEPDGVGQERARSGTDGGDGSLRGARAPVGQPGEFAPDGAVFAPLAPRTERPGGTPAAASVDVDAPLSGPADFELGPDRSRPHFDEQHGVHWVRGRSFKASAAPTGFTFIPFLGSDASRNWPVRFRLSSASIGGAALALEDRATVELRDAAFTLDRGPVDVEYQVALDGVEQLFHVERKGVSGEIVVTLDVETELLGAPFGGGLRFDGPEGGVEYGAAIAFDASGARVEVPVAYESNTLRLTVPAAFVETATGDITIDPLLTSFAVDTVSGAQVDVDTTYTSNNDAFVFVYEDTFSSADTDVYMTLVDSSGVNVDGRYVEIGTARWVDPQVAQLRGDNVALVVATEEVSGGDDPIQGRLYDTAGNDFVGPSFVVADTGGGALTWTNAVPDVGGSRSSNAGERFFVCWERRLSSGGQFARYTTVDAAGNVGFVRAMGPTDPGATVDDVRVSESAGGAAVNVWNVCFRHVPSGGTPELWAGQYNTNGSVASFVAVVRDGPLFNPTELDISDGLVVDGLEPAYVIVCDNFVPDPTELLAFVCRGSAAVGVTDVSFREHADRTNFRDTPRVATTSERFVVGYIEFEAGIYTTYATTLDLIEGTELSVAERRLALPQTSTASTFGLSIVSRASAGVFSRWVGFAYDYRDDINGDFDQTAAVVEALGPLSPAYQYCSGTENSTGDRGFMRLEGSRSASTPKVAVGEALPPNQFCLLVAGSGFDLVPALGGGEGTLCLGGALGRYNDQIAAANGQGVVTFTIDPSSIPAGGSLFSALPGDFYQF